MAGFVQNFCNHCGTQLQPGEKTCHNCGNPIKQGIPMGPLLLIIAVIGGVVILPMIVIFAAILIPNFLEARAKGQYVACQSNCKNIGTALEMYATDHQGHYPKKLSELSPKYLKSIPTCQAADEDTYSNSYRSADEPDAYTFFCKGDNHCPADACKNSPLYTSGEGLVLKTRDSEESYDEEEETTEEETTAEQQDLDACKAHLSEIGSALELYATDHKGKYPEKLSQLSPKYLQAVPTCSGAGKNTYTSSYRVDSKAKKYTLFCSGKNHADSGIPENYPRYDAEEGILEGN